MNQDTVDHGAFRLNPIFGTLDVGGFENYLDPAPKYRKILDLAKFIDHRDLKKLAGRPVLLDEITDTECPENLKVHIVGLLVVWVQAFFNGAHDAPLFELWMKTRNPELAGKTPLSFFLNGKVTDLIHLCTKPS